MKFKFKIKIITCLTVGECYARIPGSSGKVSLLTPQTPYEQSFHIHITKEGKKSIKVQLWKYQPLSPIADWDLTCSKFNHTDEICLQTSNNLTLSVQISSNISRSLLGQKQEHVREKISDDKSQSLFSTVLKSKINSLYTRTLCKEMTKKKTSTHSCTIQKTHNILQVKQNRTVAEREMLNQEQENVYGLEEFKKKILIDRR